MKESERQLSITNKNVEIIHLRIKGEGMLSLLNGYLKIIIQIRNIVKVEKIDLLINNTPLTNLICKLNLVRYLNSQKVRTLRVVHGKWGEELRHYDESRMIYGSRLIEPILPIVGSAIEKYELSSSENIISVNDHIREYIANLGIKRDIHVVPAGVNVNRYSPPKMSKSEIRINLGIQDKLTILFVGNLTEVKGVENLIESAYLILKRYDVQFIFVGGGIKMGRYLSMIEEKGVDKSIKFVGQIDDYILPLFYQACDIFCLPSLQEGLPQTLLEAMSTGLPVVATNVGGIPSIIVDGVNGYVVESKNIEMLSNRIESLIRDSDIAASMSREARMTILTKYSWDIICQEILGTLQAPGDK